MKVKIQYLGLTKNLTKQSEEQLELKEGASLSQLLNKLAGIHGAPFRREVYEPDFKDVKAGFVVTINGVLSGQLNGLDTQLQNGDSVLFMSLVTGG